MNQVQKPDQAGLFDQRALRTALSSFVTGVTIVTTQDKDLEPVGMTASSFNSVSMDPPLILWSLTKTALSAPAYQQAEHFAVHVLSAAQRALSNQFAVSGGEKCTPDNHRRDENGVPILSGVACRFDCKTWAVYEGGDHWIIVGQVTSFERFDHNSLVFAGGAYSKAVPLAPQGKTAIEQEGISQVESLLLYPLSLAYHGITARVQDMILESSCSLEEWRLLASLEGEGVIRNRSELKARTFLRVDALTDQLTLLQEQGLCIWDAGKDQVRITRKGQDKVAKLLQMGRDFEQSILSDMTPEEQAQLRTDLSALAEKAALAEG